MICHSDWYIDTSHLLGKVQMKRQQEIKCCSSRMIIELCEIRDGLASCEKITDSNICKLIPFVQSRSFPLYYIIVFFVCVYDM